MNTNYSFINLLKLRKITHNNQVESESWEASKETKQLKAIGQPQFLALATEILSKLKTRDKQS